METVLFEGNRGEVQKAMEGMTVVQHTAAGTYTVDTACFDTWESIHTAEEELLQHHQVPNVFDFAMLPLVVMEEEAVTEFLGLVALAPYAGLGQKYLPFGSGIEERQGKLHFCFLRVFSLVLCVWKSVVPRQA